MMDFNSNAANAQAAQVETKEVKNVSAEATQAAPARKVGRRGISNKTQAVSQMKFHESDAAGNGLFVGHLADVRVDWSVNAEAKSFTGLNVPRVTLEFCSNHTNPNEQRHIYHTLFPVESNVDTIPGGQKEWQVDQIFHWIKHILDVYYLRGRELTDAESDALTLTFEDYILDENEQATYNPVEPQDVLDGYRHIFESFVSMMNGTFNLKEGEAAKPCYKTADGKYIPCWMKLLRCKKVKNQWRNVTNGDLAFDAFLGAGAVELLRGSNPPAILRIDASKESITPKQVNVAPSIGGPAAPAMGGVAVPTMGGVNGPAMDMPSVGADEMPF